MTKDLLVVDGVFAIYRQGDTELLIVNSYDRMALPTAHLDGLIALLQAAQQELTRPIEVRRSV